MNIEVEIEKQYVEWSQFLNYSAITIGFLSEISALAAQSVFLSLLSFFVWICYMQYGRDKFPKIIKTIREVADGSDNVYIIEIHKKLERKYFGFYPMLKNNPLYWLTVAIYIFGFIMLITDPSLLAWNPHMTTMPPTPQPAQ